MVFKPLVTIVTPSLNQGRFLEQTILSVINQEYSPIEYMVIDGGSTDGSVKILDQYQHRLSYWESQPDLGQAHAINKGLRRSRGEILGWLNSDDILLPETVLRVVRAFAENQEIDVVYGRLERIDESGNLILTPRLPKDRIVFSHQHVIGECLVNQPGAFWRRKIMEQVGLLDERLNFAMDYDYWIRMVMAGARFKRLSEVVAQFRLSSDSKTVNQTAKMALEQLSILEKLLERDDLSEKTGLSAAEIRSKAQRTRGVIYLHIFHGLVKSGEWGKAKSWLWKALAADPTLLFQRRWLDLGAASLARRIVKYNPKQPISI